MKKEELAKNIREGIFDLLHLYSSKKDQLEFQINVPYVNVSGELFNKWFDDFYNEENPIFKKAFNEKELEILKNFNLVFEGISNETPDDVPDIVEFIETDAWKKLHENAIKTLEELVNLNIING